MATTDYETVREAALHLTPEERRRLREELATVEVQNGSASLSDAKRARLEAWFAASEELAKRVSAAWKDDMSASEAVKEQRREL